MAQAKKRGVEDKVIKQANEQWLRQVRHWQEQDRKLQQPSEPLDQVDPDPDEVEVEFATCPSCGMPSKEPGPFGLKTCSAEGCDASWDAGPVPAPTPIGAAKEQALDETEELPDDLLELRAQMTQGLISIPDFAKAHGLDPEALGASSEEQVDDPAD